MPTVWSDNEQGAELGTTFMQALLECENAAEVLAMLGASVGDVTLSGTQTLSNKTLTSPAINTPTITGGSFTGGAFTGGTDIAVADGGTGASTAANARTNLGLGSIATQDAATVALTGGSVTGITDLAIADGGTGQSTAQLAVNALSAVAAATNEHVLTKDTGTGNATWKAAAGGGIPLGHLSGCTLSTAGGSATMSTAAGQATDSTGANLMTVAALAKTTGAWAVGTGNGGKLSAAAIANSTWYHFFAIKRVDTGVVDVGFDLSATAPTMPTNYTLFRRIGSGKTDGSAQWTAFIQDGDLFQWLAIVADISAGNPGTAAVTRTLTGVPTGVSVIAKTQCMAVNSGSAGNVFALFSDLATTDTAPTTTLADIVQIAAAAGSIAYGSCNKDIRTNTSAQIRSRLSFSDASCTLTINTLGWSDTRGRDA